MLLRKRHMAAKHRYDPNNVLASGPDVLGLAADIRSNL
jgi:hypothetical protein